MKMMGASGKHMWEFQPVSDGEVTITFTYSRPWEPKADDQTLTYHYQVKSGRVVSSLQG